MTFSLEDFSTLSQYFDLLLICMLLTPNDPLPRVWVDTVGKDFILYDEKGDNTLPTIIMAAIFISYKTIKFQHCKYPVLSCFLLSKNSRHFYHFPDFLR